MARLPKLRKAKDAAAREAIQVTTTRCALCMCMRAVSCVVLAEAVPCGVKPVAVLLCYVVLCVMRWGLLVARRQLRLALLRVLHLWPDAALCAHAGLQAVGSAVHCCKLLSAAVHCCTASLYCLTTAGHGRVRGRGARGAAGHVPVRGPRGLGRRRGHPRGRPGTRRCRRPGRRGRRQGQGPMRLPIGRRLGRTGRREGWGAGRKAAGDLFPAPCVPPLSPAAPAEQEQEGAACRPGLPQCLLGLAVWLAGCPVLAGLLQAGGPWGAPLRAWIGVVSQPAGAGAGVEAQGGAGRRGAAEFCWDGAVLCFGRSVGRLLLAQCCCTAAQPRGPVGFEEAMRSCAPFVWFVRLLGAWGGGAAWHFTRGLARCSSSPPRPPGPLEVACHRRAKPSRLVQCVWVQGGCCSNHQFRGMRHGSVEREGRQEQ